MKYYDLTPTKQDIIIANQQRIIEALEELALRVFDIEKAVIILTTEK